MSSQGTAKTFNGMKGWGFIECQGTDYFVHVKDCIGNPPKVGDVLSFDLEAGTSASSAGRMQAKNVTGGTGTPGQPGGMGSFSGAVQGTGAYSGVVKSFNGEKGFGFIAVEGSDDAFCHLKQCVGSQPVQGDTVKFDLEPSRSKPGQMQATNVTGGSAPLGGGMGGMGGYAPMWGGMGCMGGMGGMGGMGMMGGKGGMGSMGGPYGGGCGGYGGGMWGGQGKGGW
ncbi:unnamed protein product [Polarella glacialis]|uniref:CSD domain-containing protein n=1 Tax=Polarella glacialis TaxID=89957 RepID=A0A813GX88_POLGL|nr:unnamed protein product [Polarella glacialis]CAE8629888.1 unnamed protein product [Polarella glacialis]